MSAQGGKAFISSHTAIMGTRTSFRPRPLDTLRQLNIVRDVKELDDGEQKVSRDIVHSHEALDKDNEEVCDHASQRNSGLLFVHHFMLASASSPLHDLSLLILVGLVVKFALHDFAYANSETLLSARVGDVAALTSPCCTTGYAYLHDLLMDQKCGSASFQGLLQGQITDLSGMCRPGWCPANKPKVAKRFRHQMSELSPHTASSICLSTRSLECISEGKVCVEQCCMRDCLPAATTNPVYQYWQTAFQALLSSP